MSEELEHWLRSDGDKTLGGLIEVFEQKSFALLFVLLLGVPALTLPTGGVTHVFEVIAIVLALQMVAGRKTIWLPRRWCRLELGGPTRERFLTGLLRMIRRLEHVSRPRFAFVFGHRTSNAVVGLLVTGFSAAAFVAPPFSASTRCPPSARSCSRWVSSSRTRRWRPRASSSLSSASRWSWPSAGRSRGASGRCSDAPLARPSSRPRRPGPRVSPGRRHDDGDAGEAERPLARMPSL